MLGSFVEKMRILGFLTLSTSLSNHAYCRTYRIEKISQLDKLLIEDGDNFLVNPDIGDEQSVEDQEESAKKMKQFLANKKFDRFVQDAESQVFYYKFSIDQNDQYLSLIERLGPQVETKLRSLIRNYQRIAGHQLRPPRS